MGTVASGTHFRFPLFFFSSTACSEVPSGEEEEEEDLPELANGRRKAAMLAPPCHLLLLVKYSLPLPAAGRGCKLSSASRHFLVAPASASLPGVQSTPNSLRRKEGRRPIGEGSLSGSGAGLTGLDRKLLLFRPARPPDAPGARLSMPGAGAGENDTLFPFFSDFKDAAVRLGLSIVETVVLASIFVLALAANAGAIRLVLRRKGRPGAASCLVLNLFCADLLFISAIPVIAVVRWTESWTMGEAVCHLLFYLMSLSGSVTILSLAAVSLERVVSIVRLKPSKPWKGRLVAACLLSVWALAALATLPLSLFFSVQPLPTRGPVS